MLPSRLVRPIATTTSVVELANTGMGYYPRAMKHLYIFSGAGLSAESGIMTFRGGTAALWNNYSIDDVCNIATWKKNYDIVHAFYGERRADIAQAEPNDAHRMIAEWQSRYPTTILTQNIDDLLERAGCENVVHLHGRANDMLCQACGTVWEHGPRPWREDDRCPCNSRRGVKPGVVMFGETAPAYSILQRALDDADPTDVFIVMGTSGNVIPIARHLVGVPSYRILNNLEPSQSTIDRDLDDSVYHQIIYQPATLAVVEIDAILRRRLQ